jgi:transposase InsO family protein
MCYALDVSKSGYYSWLCRKESKRKEYNRYLLNWIVEIHAESNGVYGAERILKGLNAKGIQCDVRLVSKLMKVAKISSKIKAGFKPSTTDSKHENRISPNLLDRNFQVEKPNQAWVSDITYIFVGNTWMYLCVIIDLFNREIIGWHFDDNMETPLLIKAYSNAVNACKPSKDCIFHSDRGVQYTSSEFRSLLEKNNMRQSMSRKGDCWDNAVAESFFKTLKVEQVNHVKYQSMQEAKTDLFRYIEIFYNRKRFHSTLGFTSPVNFRLQYEKRVA